MSVSPRDRLDFARRPFLDERPVWVLVGLALSAGAVLLVANVRMYTEFHRNVANLKTDIEQLRDRGGRAAKDAEQARAALQSYKLSSLAVESQGLLNLVAERRFSWTAFLGRLEKTLPQDVRLSRLAPRFEDPSRIGLDIGLVGRSPESVVKTIAALSADPAFHGVDLKTEASPQGGTPDGYSFDLTVFYTPPEGK